jgi:hypothetical protein
LEEELRFGEGESGGERRSGAGYGRDDVSDEEGTVR